MRLHFVGGVDTVTGSQHIIEANGSRILRDCGLFQGKRKEARIRNRELNIDVDKLTGVVLSHAHVDHCGNLPTLARLGYRGPVYATSATVSLAEIMLRDAAFIQEQDASYMNQKASRKGLPLIEPLYTVADAEAIIKQLQGVEYGDTVAFSHKFSARFEDAGHILGSSVTIFHMHEDGRDLKVGYALDLGRRDLPLIRDPYVMQDLDVLVMESTYGNRTHGDVHTAGTQLAKIIKKTFKRGGKVLIPSFALERTQELLYDLYEQVEEGNLPPIPTYVDSPMANAVTRVFSEKWEYLDEHFIKRGKRYGTNIPHWMHFISGVQESKNLTASNEPAVVISASGMCEHGRILHHFKHGIDNPANSIVFVGYQAVHTLGRRILEKQPKVRIFGDEYNLAAEVHTIDSFSAHADRNDLIEYAVESKAKQIYLVHGEPEEREKLAEALRERDIAVHTPVPGEICEL
jgi:metallo-beta-lactamase family protein